LITNQGKINLDFADVKTIMSRKGTALMGTGVAKGENRSINAVRMAISNPLMEDTSLEGASGVLLNITGGNDVTLKEIDEAATAIHEAVHEDAIIIFGMVEDPDIKDELRVMVIATGTDHELLQQRSKKVVDYPRGVGPRRQESTSIRNPMMTERTKYTSPEQNKRPKVFEQSINSKEFGVIIGEDEDENYDVPTFLRRQVD
jgi:cell division protein FtsZ